MNPKAYSVLPGGAKSNKLGNVWVFRSWLVYESAVQKPKHCLTCSFLHPLSITLCDQIAVFCYQPWKSSCQNCRLNWPPTLPPGAASTPAASCWRREPLHPDPEDAAETQENQRYARGQQDWRQSRTRTFQEESMPQGARQDEGHELYISGMKWNCFHHSQSSHW